MQEKSRKLHKIGTIGNYEILKKLDDGSQATILICKNQKGR